MYTPKEHKRDISKLRVQRVLEYIDSHLDQDLTVEDLAHVACLSRYHFGRKMFKQSTSITLHQYVLSRRIQRARDLLSTRHNSLAEIALAAGFPNQSHFTIAHWRYASGISHPAIRSVGFAVKTTDE
jgi:AraC family transcriptional regulator